MRYYHALFPLEMTLLIDGVLLIATSYAVVRYLRNSTYGFVFKIRKADASLPEQAGSLITADRLGTAAPAATGFEFGGGSGSGAGAGGKF